MKRLILSCLLLLLLCGTAALAQEGGDPSGQTQNEQSTTNQTTEQTADSDEQTVDQETSAEGEVHELDVMEVEDQRKESGTATIGGDTLKSLPSTSGSITEALKGMPNVQFSNTDNAGTTGGEISPPRISISGAKPYENNFSIDGMSVTNTLNPNGLDGDAGSAGFNDLSVNGADQTIFYDTSLLDSISVYSSNIPAKYGHFTGGVVDADLRDPRTDRWHFMTEGNYTRSKWANTRGTTENSEAYNDQPRFSIYKLKAVADGPVTDTTSVLMAANRVHSTIPLKREENDGTLVDGDQYRVSDNYFTRVMVTPSSDLKLTFDGTYAPYSEERWREAWPDSDWTIENQSYRFTSKAEYDSGLGTLTGKLAYSQNGYSRDAANNARYTNNQTNVSYGAVGDAEWENRSLDLALDFETDTLHSGDLAYVLSSGVEFNTTTTDSWNESATSEVHTYSATANRWIHTYTSYLEQEQSKSMATSGWFGQAELNWHDLTVTPGLRVDYDDFTQNLDTAPRLKAEYDVLGDGALRLVAGANRYYGSQLRAYAFDRYRAYVNHQERDNGADGTIDVVTDTVGTDKGYDMSGIRTPYSDEWTGGMLGNVMGFDYGLEFVHRDHKDQLISKTEDSKTYYMTNDGKSIYDGLTLTLSRSWITEDIGSHTLAFGATKSRTKTFDGSYASEADVDQTSSGYPYSYDMVFYDGELISRSDLPASDYNAPIILTMSWQANFLEDTLRLNSVTRWRDSSIGLQTDKRYSNDSPYGTTSGSNTSSSSTWLNGSGGYSDAYTMGVISGGFTTDLSVEWDAVKEELYTLTLLFEGYNIFDGTAESSVTEGERVGGRAFYMGLRCEF